MPNAIRSPTHLILGMGWFAPIDTVNGMLDSSQPGERPFS
jgi:hypothetical protein